MKREFNEIWKSKEGSKDVWKVQALHGIITFKRKKDAYKWASTFNEANRKYVKEMNK